MSQPMTIVVPRSDARKPTRLRQMLKLWRSVNGVSLHKLAREFDVPVSVLHRYESGLLVKSDQAIRITILLLAT